jgi:hypothetical protein
MSTVTHIQVPPRLHALVATTLLLERLDRLPRSSASAEQYQGVVRQLGRLLDEAEGDAMLHKLLERFPSLAELHENRHYAEAGLCRSPLDAAVQAEATTQDIIRRLRSRH